jgi:hypothetical protein
MLLIVAMSMEDLQVGVCIRSSPAFGKDVIDFPYVSIFEKQTTPGTMYLLIFGQSSLEPAV